MLICIMLKCIKEIVVNPFKYGCVVDGEYYCARPVLSRQLASFVASGQNVVIQGERRMGKTSLVKETVGGMRNIRLLYVDLLYIRTVEDLCQRIARAVSQMDSTRSFLDRTVGLISRLRPTLSFDDRSGAPVLSVDTASARRPDSVETLLDMIAEHGRKRKICVVFDEFQDIQDLDCGNQILAVMRSRIQFDSRTSHVFLGSVRNRMSDIFWSPSSPFYHSAAALPVGRIDEDDFRAFIEGRFATGRRRLSDESWRRIVDVADGTPGYVQEFCEAVWNVTEKGCVIGSEELGNALELIFSRECDHYGLFVRDLTTLQLKVLRALARLGGKGVCSVDFLSRAGVLNAASVKRALVRLENAELVYQFENEYRFLNPFFREWVRRLP